MSAAVYADPIGPVAVTDIADRADAARALGIVRDGVITGEGPTAGGRIHFSRTIDAADVAWCSRILTAAAVDSLPISRHEAEALFAINDAASDRRDDGQFDDLFAKAVVHHVASVSGLPVPSRSVALSTDVTIDSWAPTRAIGVNVEALEWMAAQMRGTRRNNTTLRALAATIIGAAALPLAQQFPALLDLGM